MMLRFISLFCALAWMFPAFGDVRPIHFERGAGSAVVSGAVVRGTRDVLSFEARKGQSAKIVVTSIENNAVIAIWRPGAKVSFGEFVDVEGRTLPGVAEENDANSWRGRLPESGSYLIVVGPTRGNTTYKMKIVIDK